MQYRVLGRSNLKVSAIGFGAIKLPEVSQPEANKALNRALDLGINFIDTARAYQDSETKIGQALKHRRKHYYLATKTVARDAAGVKEDLRLSLKELQTDYIDLYFLHSVNDENSFNQVTSPGGALEGVKLAQKEGKIKHIGISVHRSINVMEKSILSDNFDVIMLAFSPIDQEGVSGIIPLAHQRNMGVIIMKPLAGGRLAEPGPAREKNDYNKIVRTSLKYILTTPGVSSVVPGMRSVKEVEENVVVGDAVAFTEEEEKELYQTIGKLGEKIRYNQNCLRCKYCQPCPEDILIPEVFRAYYNYTSYDSVLELKEMGLRLYQSLPVKPDACQECQECEEKCPAGLPISEEMHKIARFFSEL